MVSPFKILKVNPVSFKKCFRLLIVLPLPPLVLTGGMGRALVFEGEPDHLVPVASEVLLESNLFQVAGRMLAHSFLHEGPRVAGLSPAVIHVLCNGDPEMATVVTEDCPDLHIRSIIKLVCNTKNILWQKIFGQM